MDLSARRRGTAYRSTRHVLHLIAWVLVFGFIFCPRLYDVDYSGRLRSIISAEHLEAHGYAASDRSTIQSGDILLLRLVL